MNWIMFRTNTNLKRWRDFLFIYLFSFFFIGCVIYLIFFHSAPPRLRAEGQVGENCISGSKVTEILLKGWILTISGVASGRVCTCSLHSRLVLKQKHSDFTPKFGALRHYFCFLNGWKILSINWYITKQAYCAGCRADPPPLKLHQ